MLANGPFFLHKQNYCRYLFLCLITHKMYYKGRFIYQHSATPDSLKTSLRIVHLTSLVNMSFSISVKERTRTISVGSQEESKTQKVSKRKQSTVEEKTEEEEVHISAQKYNCQCVIFCLSGKCFRSIAEPNSL